MTYVIRDERGTLIAEVKNDIFHKITRGVPGYFKTITRNGTVKTVYEVTEDTKTSFLGFTFYMWSGYVLIPK
jgi:hypothetical protein